MQHKIEYFFYKNRRLLFISDILLFLIILVIIICPAKPEDVVGLKVNATSYSTAQLEWTASEKADNYKIYRATEDGDFQYLTFTPETQYNDTELRTGTLYKYMVVAVNGLKSSSKNTENSVDVQTELDTPQLSISTDNGKIELIFPPVDGAKEYEIIRDGKTLTKTTSIPYIDTEASNDAPHEYQVKAIRYKKNPVYSKASNKEKAELHTIPNFTMSANADTILLDWDNSEFYNTYKIFFDNSLLGETENTDFAINDYETNKKYNLKIIGYKDNTQSPEINKNIQITEEPKDNKTAINDAVEWALNIANDDSFTYGVGDRAHRFGCYFCQTNVGPRLNLKGKSKVNGHSYEKTYCCNPFISAAYAHGAGDPKMLTACRAGSGISMKKKSYTRYGCWKDLGKPSYSKLQKGDVLVKSNHVSMYIGDNKIVQAGPEGWGANTIKVSPFPASKYKAYKFVMRYTGNGGGTMYKVNEIED